MRTPFKRLIIGLSMLLAMPVFAQATRTWVSGVGDDANPASRTAPCKTFAGAISKTAPGGEIDCLDPGGFGGVTITKGITLDGGGGQVGSILVSGTNAVIVAAGANDVVILRNLRINGIGSGLSAVKFISGKALILENCEIMGFTVSGVDVNLSAAASLSISSTAIVGIPSLATSGGITVEPSSAAVTVDLDHVKIWSAGGEAISAGLGKLAIQNSEIASSGTGLALSGSADAQIDGTRFSGNTTGIALTGGTARFFGCTITQNGTGVLVHGGAATSLGDNRIRGNGSGNTLGGGFGGGLLGSL